MTNCKYQKVNLRSFWWWKEELFQKPCTVVLIWHWEGSGRNILCFIEYLGETPTIQMNKPWNALILILTRKFNILFIILKIKKLKTEGKMLKLSDIWQYLAMVLHSRLDMFRKRWVRFYIPDRTKRGRFKDPISWHSKQTIWKNKVTNSYGAKCDSYRHWYK